MTKKKYLVPSLTVVRLLSEHGYAVSMGVIDPEQINRDIMLLGAMQDNEYQQTETFNIYWTDDENNGFFN